MATLELFSSMQAPDKTKFHNNYSPDITVFLILIPFISAINYYLTYTNIELNGFLLLRFSIDTAQGYLAWWAVRGVIIYLDKKLPYSNGAAKRIWVQVIVTILVGLFVIASTTEILSLIIKGEPAPPAFYFVDLVIISIWFFVINGIYVCIHYYKLWKQMELTKAELDILKHAGLVVKHGKTDLKIEFDEIEALYVDDDYVVACHVNSKQYYLDQSLDKIEKGLPSSTFFRLNRQFLIHRQVVTGFKRAENGKINVLTKTREFLPTEITVSRLKAPAFRSWFRS
jgi:DNA-binding LytR/AlgR family response regulator